MNTTQPDYSTMSIAAIAGVIQRDWKNVNFAAKPYLQAMQSLTTVQDKYFNDDGISVVGYFLCNARSWTSETAKAVKAELNRRLGRK